MTGLSGARVVVTGGAGTIGSHIVDAAVDAGAREVIALDALVRGIPANLDAALKTGKASLRELDIRDREAVAASIDGADLVFHQAALRWTRCQESPRECHEVTQINRFDRHRAGRLARELALAIRAFAVADDEHRPIAVRRIHARSG